MHYIDEGPRDGEPVLMLHGEPSWSYLYRKMIPIIVEGGLRAIAPDLIGFGRSDKPASQDEYSYQAHVDWIADFVEQLDLRGATLVGVAAQVGQAVPVRVQRRRPGDARRRSRVSAGGARHEGAAAHDDPWRWALPAGGQGRRVGARDRRLHRQHEGDSMSGITPN